MPEVKMVPKAVGPYSAAKAAGNVIAVSGQLPLNPETGQIEVVDVTAQAAQSLRNVAAVLAEFGCTLNDVFKTTVLLADMDDFAAVNEVYANAFKDVEKYPARSAFQVAALPMGARVEIEALASCPTK